MRPQKVLHEYKPSAPLLRHLFPAGWAALLDKPNGFFSLNAAENAISDASYDIMRRCVSELQYTFIKHRSWELVWLRAAQHKLLEGGQSDHAPCGHGYFGRMLAVSAAT